MGLNESYISGGQEKEIWEKIKSWSSESDFEFTEASLILEECMRRGVLNLQMIKDELPKYGYVFENIGDINGNYTVLKMSLSGYNSTWINHFTEFGQVPFSLISFYKKIDGIDFRGYFDFWDNPYYLDALYIFSQHAFREINDNPSSVSIAGRELHQLLISPDEYIKEGDSGDVGCAILLPSNQELDGTVLNFRYKISFVEYLRLNFKWAGLVGLELYAENEMPKEIKMAVESICEKLLPI